MKPRFDRSLGYVHRPADLLHRGFGRQLHTNRLTEFVAESEERTIQPDVALVYIANLLRTRRWITDLKAEHLISIRLRVKRYFRSRSPLTEHQQGGVDGNPRQPRVEASPSLKRMQRQKCAEKSILKRIFGIVAILRNRKDCFIKAARVTIVQFRKCSGDPGPRCAYDFMLFPDPCISDSHVSLHDSARAIARPLRFGTRICFDYFLVSASFSETNLI
jgi:hypothetical protein